MSRRLINGMYTHHCIASIYKKYKYSIKIVMLEYSRYFIWFFERFKIMLWPCNVHVATERIQLKYEIQYTLLVTVYFSVFLWTTYGDSLSNRLN